MKLLYDLLPIALFFLAYKFYGIYIATIVVIAALAIQALMMIIKKQKPDLMQSITFIMVLILGGSTLLFKNEMFIKWKPTAVYWALALTFSLTQWIGNKNLVQKLLEKNLNLPPKGWITLNTSWVGFFALMGILNLIVVYNFDTDTWVNFKLFGTLALTFGFVIFQYFLVSRYLPKSE